MKHLLLTTIAGVLLCQTVFAEGTALEKMYLPPHTFSLPKGFTLKPVAAPPLVQRPIHMYFDEGGTLYVTDSSGNSQKAPVQLKNPSHRILRLVDRDGDGVFDHSMVFAEKVPFPEGILVYKRSVYVGAPPHICKFTDTDGDHVSDSQCADVQNCRPHSSSMG